MRFALYTLLATLGLFATSIVATPLPDGGDLGHDLGDTVPKQMMSWISCPSTHITTTTRIEGEGEGKWIGNRNRPLIENELSRSHPFLRTLPPSDEALLGEFGRGAISSKFHPPRKLRVEGLESVNSQIVY
ncbi:hypothetical protein BDZ94DRAFT_1232327 [Collybia nuda]|uniref:Uncharacterized protein n=1 Tax=Collybia nuda TaxID=64659 RepID=A0A9P6CPR3_9AGAR|nr:hypothetical protein BDZ94DRAFT_1232327 [Collybia nuda]